MSLVAGAWILLSLPAQAAFSIPGYELVYNAPQETTLQDSDLRNAAEVWQQMLMRRTTISMWRSFTWQMKKALCWTAC